MRLEMLINDNYDKLNENDLYIWNYILSHKKECQNLSIQELAAKCNISHTTISRFCKKLGLSGYGELKLFIKWDLKPEKVFDSKEIMNSYYDYIKTMDIIIKQDLSDIYDFVDQGGRIYAYGTGDVQKSAVKELKRVLLYGGYIVHVLEGREETRFILDHLKENDVFFLYSFSGENHFMNEFARCLKNRGIRIVTITRNGSNELSRMGDVSLQFYCHPIIQTKNHKDIYMAAHFFLINEFILLKLLEHQSLISET